MQHAGFPSVDRMGPGDWAGFAELRRDACGGGGLIDNMISLHLLDMQILAEVARVRIYIVSH